MSQVLFLLLALKPVFVFSYNVDTGYPILFTDPEPEGSNYFGYSVSLSPGRSSQVASLLVGAPRTSDGEGRVYRCTENGSDNSSCKALKIDPATAPREVRVPGGEFTIITGKSGGLGSSMAMGTSSNFLVCAPYSPVTFHTTDNESKKKFMDDMRGYCYDGYTDTLYRDNDILTSKNRYPFVPFITDLYGFSIHYAVRKDQISVGRIIGQPHLNSVEIKHGYRTHTESLEFDQRSNLGYSVSSGYFFHSNQLLFVAGAPGWLSKGKVVVYFPNWFKKIVTESAVLGEYFGASLTSGDFDGDGLDDLAVGAPHWGQVDFGRVYTFYSSYDVSQPKFVAGLTLQGEAANGQFGYALATADLDSDGCSDLVISAPWENSGVVYIYYGHSDFRREDSSAKIIQRIETSKFGRPLLQVQRFGFSLSNSIDVDENGYPDFAIGAYKSGQAFVLRSKPVIETEVKLISNPIALTKSTPSFVVSVCVKYHGKKAPNTQVLQFEMSADADYKRVENGSSNIFADRFSRDQMGCSNQTILLRNGIRNFVDPILINVKHSITEKNTNEFCSSCPVLSKKTPRESVEPLIITFNTGCRDGVICNANLSIDASFGGTGPNDEWVVGSGDISLNLLVRNDGEPAYLTDLIIDMPPRIRLRNAITSCRESLKKNMISLICDIANPLESNEQKHLSIILDMEHMAEVAEGTIVTFNITRRTRSVDHGKENPITSLSLTVKYVAYLTLTGVTDKKSLDYGRTGNKSKVHIRHTYQIAKFGSTPVTEAILTIHVPASINGRSDSFLNIGDPKLMDSSGKTHDCYISDSTSGSEQTNWFDDPDTDKRLQKNRRAAPDDSHETAETTVNPSASTEEPEATYDELGVYGNNTSGVILEEGLTTDRTVYLNCSTEGVFCVQLVCQFALPKISDDVGNVALYMLLNADRFYTSTSDSLTLIFNTNASVEILRPRISHDKFSGNISAVVSTMLYNIPEPQKLAGWIIPSSIVFGILLFSILAVILYRVGFFNRLKKVDMAKAKELRLIVKEEENDDERYG